MPTPNYQYEPLPVPPSWGPDGKRLVQRISDVLDDIYLKWGRIDSNLLAANAVKNKNIADGAVSDRNVTSIDAAKVNRLDAVSFEAIRARIQELATDILTSIVFKAKFGEIETADIDFARIKHSVTGETVMESGVAGMMYMHSLVVTASNLLSATISRLVMPSTDGKYYAVVVGSNGVLHTEEVTVSEDEVAAGQTADGRQIVATTINAESINGQTINAQSGVINTILTTALTAGKITAGEALVASATIPQLYVTAIEAIGNIMTFGANERIQFLLGAANTVNKWITFDNQKGLIIQKPAWTDGEGVEHPASLSRTQTDESGYHVFFSDVADPVGSFTRRGLISSGVQVSRQADALVARDDGEGGWVWD